VTTFTLWPATNGPVTDSATTPISLGTEFKVTGAGWLVGFRVWRATTGDTGITVAAFTAGSGVVLSGSTTAVPDGGTDWRTVSITPIPLTIGVPYVAVAHHPVRYPGTGGYWLAGQPGGSGHTEGILYAPPDSAVPAGQGRFLEGASIAAPTQTYQGGCYWITPIVSDEDPAGVGASGSAVSAGSATAVRSTVATGSGSADTTGSASAIRAVVAAAVGSGSGSGAAEGGRLAVASSVGSSESAGSAVAERLAVAAATGTALTMAVALGRRTAVAAAVGGASGSGVVDGDGRTALGGGVSSGLASIHPLIRRPRRGIIHRP